MFSRIVLLIIFLSSLSSISVATVLIDEGFTSQNVFLDIDTHFERQEFNSDERSWREILADIKRGSPYRVKPFTRRDIARFTVAMKANNQSNNETFTARFKMANFRDIQLYVIQNDKLVFQSMALATKPLSTLAGLGVRDDIYLPRGDSTIILTWSGFNVGVFSNLTVWNLQELPEQGFQFLSLIALGVILGLSFYHLLLAVFDKSIISLCYVCYGVPVVTLFLAYQGMLTEIFGLIDIYGRIYCMSFLIVSAAIVWLIFLLLNARLYLKHGLTVMKIYSLAIGLNVVLFVVSPLTAILLFEPLLTFSWFMFVGVIFLVGIKGVKLPTFFVYLWCPIMASLGALTIFSSAFQEYYSQELSYILLCADFIVMSLLLSTRVGRARQAMSLSLENEKFVSQLSELLRKKVMPKAKLLESYGKALSEQGMTALGQSLTNEAGRFQGAVLDLEGASFNWVSHPERVHLESFFKNIQQQFRYLAAQKGLELSVCLQFPTSEVIIDKRALEHIVINLLNNSIRYTEEGGINLKSSLKGGVLQLEVSDTGPGVDVNILPNLFKPFSSLANTKQNSHGLGLYICHKVINKLGGTIQYQERAGSTFLVAMPVKWLSSD